MHQIEKIKVDSWSENYSPSRDTQDQIYFRYNGRMIRPITECKCLIQEYVQLHAHWMTKLNEIDISWLSSEIVFV